VKIIKGLVLAFCMLAAFPSCDKLLPIDYDKAGRDLAALMRRDASLTMSDYRSMLNDLPNGMSSKDFFTMLKMEGSIYQFTQLLSLDMANARMKEYGVDVKNLKRALEE
jgi:hypothetical protein